MCSCVNKIFKNQKKNLFENCPLPKLCRRKAKVLEGSVAGNYITINNYSPKVHQV